MTSTSTPTPSSSSGGIDAIKESYDFQDRAKRDAFNLTTPHPYSGYRLALERQVDWLKDRVTDRELPENCAKDNETYLIESGMPKLPATSNMGGIEEVTPKMVDIAYAAYWEGYPGETPDFKRLHKAAMKRALLTALSGKGE